MNRLELARRIVASQEITCDKCDVVLVVTDASEINDWVAVRARCPRCATLYTVRVTERNMARYAGRNG